MWSPKQKGAPRATIWLASKAWTHLFVKVAAPKQNRSPPQRFKIMKARQLILEQIPNVLVSLQRSPAGAFSRTPSTDLMLVLSGCSRNSLRGSALQDLLPLLTSALPWFGLYNRKVREHGKLRVLSQHGLWKIFERSPCTLRGLLVHGFRTCLSVVLKTTYRRRSLNRKSCGNTSTPFVTPRPAHPFVTDVHVHSIRSELCNTAHCPQLCPVEGEVNFAQPEQRGPGETEVVSQGGCKGG